MKLRIFRRIHSGKGEVPMSPVSQHLDNLLAQRGVPLWGGYVNMLKTLASVFLSPKHWVLEFLQNAEDAEAKRFSISLGQDALRILNDGRPFNNADFCAICDVNSRKLPSLGFRGYIGIGFKSIFRITDRVDIHSGEYDLKFDKAYWDDCRRGRIPLSEWPWEILPVEINPEALPEAHTTGFYVPLGSGKAQGVLQEINDFLVGSDFPKESILLLRNVEAIDVQTPQVSFTIRKDTEESETLSIGTREQVLVEKQYHEPRGREEAHFLVVRKTVQVPLHIRKDEETERVRRANVAEREIGLVFGLDHGKNLQALQGKLAGVYSFLPVEGEQTGLPFGVFGDFIPQPGRDLISYRARWNHWMCDAVADFFKQVVYEVFLPHPQWMFFPAELLSRVQYSSTSGPGKEFWDTGLRDPIKEFLASEALYPDEDGQLRTLDELIVVSEEVAQIVGKDMLRSPMDKKIAHPSIKKLVTLEAIHIYDLLHRRETLEAFKGQPEKLAGLYRLIGGLSDYCIKGRPNKRGALRDVPLSRVPFVLGVDGEFYPPDEIVTLEIDVDRVPRILMATLVEQKRLLHPQIAKDTEAVKQLIRCSVVSEGSAIWRLQRLIDNITTPERCPTSWKYPDDLIEATLFLFSASRTSYISLGNLVAEDRTLQEPKKLFVPGAPMNWFPLWKSLLLPGFQPVYEKYFDKKRLKRHELQREEVDQYLGRLGAHGFQPDEDKSLIESAAYAIARERLKEEGHSVADVTQRKKLGYDLLCQGHCGKVFEVKGMARPSDVTLTESEVSAAQQKREDYVLICVYNLPAHPDRVGYKAIPNPERIWQPIGQARVPKDKWL